MTTPTTSPPAPETTPEQAFVNQLRTLARRADDGDSTARARLARLRRTLTGRTVSFDGLQEIGDALPPNLSDQDLGTYLLLAGLFAMNPAATGQDNLGAALGHLRHNLSAGAESLDRRMAALLDADAGELPYRLRQVMQQLAAHGIAFNHLQLLRDLLRWDHPTRRVQRQWAKDYWVR